MKPEELSQIIQCLTMASFNQGSLGAYEEMTLIAPEMTKEQMLEFIRGKVSALSAEVNKAGNPVDIIKRIINNEAQK